MHSARAQTGVTDWRAIRELYALLLQTAPSVGAVVAAAGAALHDGDRDDAIELLDAVPATSARDYQPYWVCRAAVLRAARVAAGHASANEAEAAARSRAVGLTSDPLLRAFLLEQASGGVSAMPR